ncbi:hypothetical protein NDU88_005188 [Pleurodeles waltl]|uniref:Uncharacterized protein n=1 Tax=Pleurodeles waltl TaxID=8319 RepID=A0AAV7PHU3_PLEWA|nr:hypothetical protein NDU88_005188 [Pleurodeles waltl]
MLRASEFQCKAPSARGIRAVTRREVARVQQKQTGVRVQSPTGTCTARTVRTIHAQGHTGLSCRLRDTELRETPTLDVQYIHGHILHSWTQESLPMACRLGQGVHAQSSMRPRYILPAWYSPAPSRSQTGTGATPGPPFTAPLQWTYARAQMPTAPTPGTQRVNVNTPSLLVSN